MGYSNEVLTRATKRLAAAREDRASLAAARQAQAYRQVPRLRELDGQMRRNMAAAALAAFSQGAENAIEEARQKNKALEAERQALLKANFPPDFWVEESYCPVCGGSGWLGSTMCGCLKALCVEEQRQELGKLFAGNMSFETFRLELYSDLRDPAIGAAPRTVMEKTLQICRSFARSFTPQAGNLLFIGGTGLGKTHLAVAMGRVVGDMGYGVCYESAAGLFSKLEAARFSPSEDAAREAKKLEQCDLLIIDDLGTEMPGQFVTAALYSLLNNRLMAGKPMLITTNLNVDEAGKRYSPQIASRLYGEFQRLTFVGTDIRRRK